MTTTPDLWRNPFIDNTSLTGTQDSGVVAPTAGDFFFAVWVDRTNFNGGLDTIVASKFDSLGNPATGDVPLPLGNFPRNADEPAAVRLPIAGQADGLAVAFTSHFSAVDDDIYLVRKNALLDPIGALFITIDSSTDVTDHPSITSFNDGSVWVSY